MWERAGRGRQNVSVDSVPNVGATARLLFCRIAGFAGSAKGVDNGEDRKKTTGLSSSKVYTVAVEYVSQKYAGPREKPPQLSA